MEEEIYYGNILMDNLRNLLLEEKRKTGSTNLALSVRCEISTQELDNILYKKDYGKYGCSFDTLYKIIKNTHISPDDLFSV